MSLRPHPLADVPDLAPHPVRLAGRKKKKSHGLLLLTKRRLDLDEDDHDQAVVQKNGVVRQAGAHPHQQAFMKGLKRRAEAELFIFSKSILNCRWLTKPLHLPATRFLQQRSAYVEGAWRDVFSKLLMFPRECGKTTMVGHSLPLHIHIQPADHNCYFPGEHGSQQPIVLAGETEKRAADALFVIQDHAQNNELLRAIWPESFWPGVPRQHTKIWNKTEMLLPRLANQQLPDPSIRALGVGAAVAGSHPRVLIKDDLVTKNASNSLAIMEDAIQWHVVSRALINRPGCLEFIIGTHWATYDLYSYIDEHDNIEKGGRVLIFKKGLIEDGECIYPRFEVELNGIKTEFGFDDDRIEKCRKEFGVMFPLMYMNLPFDSSLTDFSADQIRYFTVQNDEIHFDGDERDLALAELDFPTPVATTSHLKGQVLTPQNYDFLARRSAHLRARG